MNHENPVSKFKFLYSDGDVVIKKSIEADIEKIENIGNKLQPKKVFSVLESCDNIQKVCYYFTTIYYEIYIGKLNMLKQFYEDDPINMVKSNLYIYCEENIKNIIENDLKNRRDNQDSANLLVDTQDIIKRDIYNLIPQMVDDLQNNIKLIMEKYINTDIEHSGYKDLLCMAFEECRISIENNYREILEDKRIIDLFEKYRMFLIEQIKNLEDFVDEKLKVVNNYIKRSGFVSKTIPLTVERYNYYKERLLKLSSCIDKIFNKADENIFHETGLRIQTTEFHKISTKTIYKIDSNFKTLNQESDLDIKSYIKYIKTLISSLLTLINNEQFNDIPNENGEKIILTGIFATVQSKLIILSQRITQLTGEYENEYIKNGKTLYEGLEKLKNTLNLKINKSKLLVETQKRNIETNIIKEHFYLTDELKILENYSLLPKLNIYQESLEAYIRFFIPNDSNHQYYMQQIDRIKRFKSLIIEYQKGKIEYIVKSHNVEIFNSIYNQAHTIFKGMTFK